MTSTLELTGTVRDSPTRRAGGGDDSSHGCYLPDEVAATLHPFNSHHQEKRPVKDLISFLIWRIYTYIEREGW